MNEMPRDPVKAEGEFVQVRKIGDAFCVVLSEELVARLQLAEGDTLRIVEQGDGGITLAPHNAKHAKAMDIARRSFVTYAETYKALAK